jgi:hypothetical protein
MLYEWNNSQFLKIGTLNLNGSSNWLAAPPYPLEIIANDQDPISEQFSKTLTIGIIRPY